CPNGFTQSEHCDTGEQAVTKSFRTLPSNPGPPDSPELEKRSEAQYWVYLEKPPASNGPIDSFHIRQVDPKTGLEENFTVFGSDNFAEIDVDCSDSIAANRTKTLQVQVAGLNFLDTPQNPTPQELMGEFS